MKEKKYILFDLDGTLTDPKEGITKAVQYSLAPVSYTHLYRVYHDTSVYDLQSGVLDRSKAYNYALEGVNRILQQNPSIQVVLDLHRDGVSENQMCIRDRITLPML